MATYVILSRVSPKAFNNPGEFRNLAREVGEKIRSQCPDLVWKASYGLFGRFDVLDIVETEDPKEVAKAAGIIRAYGHASTESMPAVSWDEFLESM